ncbi:MAG: lycopene cyclase domain-containing protein [Pseudomonadales bacterium]|nr:lycopene cyclase domain-containing protein [Candidatus Woesebacteria bacterium]MCB9801948.1 lycopene cyclase domain-containing protein [Pseudomonadales bacterium]
MTYTYALLLLSIVFFPLLLAHTRQFSFAGEWRRFAWVCIVLLLFFIPWDVAAHSIGHWWFNPEYTLPYTAIGLPLEEWGFFTAVSFSMLFLYVQLRRLSGAGAAYPPVSSRQYCLYYTAVLALAVILPALALLHVSYTALVVLAAVCTLCLWRVFGTADRALSAHLMLGFVFFFIYNYALTSLPVVLYGSPWILGVRMLTIPVEDSLYNGVLLILIVLTYQMECRKKV